MKKLIFILFVNLLSLNLFAQVQTVEVQGDITSNTHWSNDKFYLLKGFVRVKNGATLTIDPGTIVKGHRLTKGTLIIERGGKIIADGTPSQPIVFTSERGIGLRQPGDWGGVVICGKAPNNNPGGEAELEGNYGAFHGGTDPNDNSGILRYVRIEFAGVPINPNQEVNSLTMGSVGRGTLIENVMCSYGLDDAFEWFGGTVNAKNLIAYRCLDDDLDMDNGFGGNVQFVLIIRDATLADQSGSNSFEVDNDGSGSLTAPFTAPVLSNVTVIGPKKEAATAISAQYRNGMHLRRSTKIKVYNSFITGFPAGVLLDGANTYAHAQADELQLRNIVLAGVDGWGSTGWGKAALDSANSASVTNWFYTSSYNNQILSKWQDAGIHSSIFDLDNNIQVVPNSGSMLLSGANFSNPHLQNAFFTSVNYIGAFGTDDWTTLWANWNPLATDYSQLMIGVEEFKNKGIDVLRNAPNPFSSSTTISFALINSDDVQVEVYDISGKRVAVLADERLTAGNHQFTFDASALASGIYTARVQTSKASEVIRIVIMK